jgi:hypothetical protein
MRCRIINISPVDGFQVVMTRTVNRHVDAHTCVLHGVSSKFKPQIFHNPHSTGDTNNLKNDREKESHKRASQINSFIYKF